MNLSDYGVPGVIATVAIAAIIGCVVWIKNIIKEHHEEREDLERMHRSERDDWKKTIERQFEESNKVTNKNTDILSELSTLIKSRK